MGKKTDACKVGLLWVPCLLVLCVGGVWEGYNFVGLHLRTCMYVGVCMWVYVCGCMYVGVCMWVYVYEVLTKLLPHSEDPVSNVRTRFGRTCLEAIQTFGGTLSPHVQ